MLADKITQPLHILRTTILFGDGYLHFLVPGPALMLCGTCCMNYVASSIKADQDIKTQDTHHGFVDVLSWTCRCHYFCPEILLKADECSLKIQVTAVLAPK